MLLAMIAGTMGKIAHEVILLQKSEVMELEEPHHHGKVGSSTMPHKRNPMGCEGIMALSRLARSLAPALLESHGDGRARARLVRGPHRVVRPARDRHRGRARRSAQTRDVIADLIVYPRPHAARTSTRCTA